jgi:hypothetical protein
LNSSSSNPCYCCCCCWTNSDGWSSIMHACTHAHVGYVCAGHWPEVPFRRNFRSTRTRGSGVPSEFCPMGLARVERRHHLGRVGAPAQACEVPLGMLDPTNVQHSMLSHGTSIGVFSGGVARQAVARTYAR